MNDQAEIVATWLRYQESRSRADFWAVDQIMAATGPGGDPEIGWPLVEALYRAAPDELLGAIAAGPLEDLVTFHTTAVIDRVEQLARREPRFRSTVSRIWLTEGALPIALEQRVVRASNGAITPRPNAQAKRRRR